MMMRSITFLLLTLFVSQSDAQSLDEQRALNDQQWQDDLSQLAQSVNEIHFNPYTNLSSEDFKLAVTRLSEMISGASDAEIIIEMAKLVALLKDGHTRLHIPRQYPEFALEAELGHSGTPPPKVETLRFRQLPIKFRAFDDGVFITGAMPEQAKLIGKKLVSVHGVPTEEVLQRLWSVSFHENQWRANLLAADRLALPEVLAAFGLADTWQEVELTTTDVEGQESEIRLQPLTGTSEAFVQGLPEKRPLWLKDPHNSEWYQLLPNARAIYVQVNRFEEQPDRPYAEFVAETLAAANNAGAERYIIDLRHNSGGTGTWTIPFITGLARSQFNQYGRLFVLIGETTFSAAQHFLHQLEAYTYAMFVGTPSGASPSHFGDPKRIVLENSGLTLRVSTIYWHSWLGNDFRDSINPHIDAPIRSTDYFEGQDPALTAALEYRAPETIASQIDEQMRLGHIQNALLLFQRYQTDGHQQVLAEATPGLIDAANQLLHDDYTKPGLFLFIVLNNAFPGNPEIEKGLSRGQTMLEATD